MQVSYILKSNIEQGILYIEMRYMRHNAENTHLHLYIHLETVKDSNTELECTTFILFT